MALLAFLKLFVEFPPVSGVVQVMSPRLIGKPVIPDLTIACQDEGNVPDRPTAVPPASLLLPSNGLLRKSGETHHSTARHPDALN